MVSTPVITQTTSSQPGEPTWREISPETIKIPEPIIDPATIIVESSRPRPRTKPPRVIVPSSAASAAILYHRLRAFRRELLWRAARKSLSTAKLKVVGENFVGAIIRRLRKVSSVSGVFGGPPCNFMETE